MPPELVEVEVALAEEEVELPTFAEELEVLVVLVSAVFEEEVVEVVFCSKEEEVTAVAGDEVVVASAEEVEGVKVVGTAV